jgi:hypothetical protein
MSVISHLGPCILDLDKNKNEFCLTKCQCALSVPRSAQVVALSISSLTCFYWILNGSLIYWRMSILRSSLLRMKFILLAVQFLNYSYGPDCTVRCVMHNVLYSPDCTVRSVMHNVQLQSGLYSTFCNAQLTVTVRTVQYVL